MKSTVLRKVLVGVGVALVGIQLVPVERSNPPSDGAMALPAGEVGEILTGACMDCHSHETVWPWYASVAPVKFVVAKHVNDGRRHLNFSTWGAQDVERRDHKLEEIVEVVKSGEMPEGSYTWMHPEARLTDEQRYALTAWAEAERARVNAPDTASAAQADTAATAAADSAAGAPDPATAPGGAQPSSGLR